MKKELIEKIMSLTHPTQDLAYIGKGYLKQILEEELPDFQRIDWERLRDCFEKASNGYVSSHLHVAVKEYNSTLPPALVPLPKEMPKWFHNGISYHDLWSMVCLNYGTPDKPNLPSVEELAKEITVVFNQDSYDMMRSIAQHLHDKYSLHPREWWKGDIKGMKVIHTQCGDEKIELSGKIFVEATSNLVFDVNKCTPYTPLSAQDIIKKHNLSDEEVRAIREGKC